jgi:transposase
MRGADAYNEALFSTVRLEDFVPGTHPLRPIRKWINEALAKMDEKFSAMYEADIRGGRPSIAPEKLMRAMLLQVLYSVRSERQLVEQLSYNLLFRWFVGLAIEDTVWNHSVFSENRDFLIEHDAVTELFNATVKMARKKGLLSGEHFRVDGTLIQAWGSHKSMRRKEGSDDGRLQPHATAVLGPVAPAARVMRANEHEMTLPNALTSPSHALPGASERDPRYV